MNPRQSSRVGGNYMHTYHVSSFTNFPVMHNDFHVIPDNCPSFICFIVWTKRSKKGKLKITGKLMTMKGVSKDHSHP